MMLSQDIREDPDCRHLNKEGRVLRSATAASNRDQDLRTPDRGGHSPEIVLMVDTGGSTAKRTQVRGRFRLALSRPAGRNLGDTATSAPSAGVRDMTRVTRDLRGSMRVSNCSTARPEPPCTMPCIWALAASESAGRKVIVVVTDGGDTRQQDHRP